MVIRKMVRKDFPEVAKVIIASLNNEGEAWTLESSLGHIEENYSENYSFIIRENEEVVGFILGSEITMFDLEGVFIDLVCVLPGYQSQGIGSKLYKKLINVAKENGKKGFSLLSNPEWKAHKWYEKMGYKKTGWVELYKYFNEDD